MGGPVCRTKEPKEDKTPLGSHPSTKNLRDKNQKSRKSVADETPMGYYPLVGTPKLVERESPDNQITST